MEAIHIQKLKLNLQVRLDELLEEIAMKNQKHHRQKATAQRHEKQT